MSRTAEFLIAVAAIFAIVAAAACGTTQTVTHNVPGPTVTATPPAVTQTVTAPPVTHTATAPAQVSTVTASPPPPTAGATLLNHTGSGNSVTPSFTVPDSGNYVVAWQYSGNDSSGIGGDNFSISNTGSGFTGNLPNDIATSGHGSTEVTGDSGTESFNVQADSTCTWTITVTAA